MENGKITTYEKLVSSCKYLLRKGWTPQKIYRFMEEKDEWAPDSIEYAIREAEEMIQEGKGE